ncbi:MAG: tyrosine-type recombinase/integrase [bacterium]
MNSSLAHIYQYNHQFQMVGRINSKEKCPICHNKFILGNKGLICPKCKTTPKRYYIDLPWTKEVIRDGKRVKIKQWRYYTSPEGYVFTSYDLAQKVLILINSDIEKERESKGRFKFDTERYIFGNGTKPLKFENHIMKWLENKKTEVEQGKRAPSYLASLKRIIKKYILPYFKDIELGDIRNSHIEDFALSLPKHLKPKSQKNIIDVLRGYLNNAVRRGDFKPDDSLFFPEYDCQPYDWHWAEFDVQERLYQNIPDEHKPIFFFLKETGRRPGEARALWREDIDFEHNSITIKRNFSEGIYREITKHKNVDKIFVDDELLGVLKRIPIINGFIFLNPNTNRPYTQWTLDDLYRQALEKAGVKNLKLYEWGRHSYASQSANSGVPVELIGSQLGHKDKKTTMKYAHIDLKGKKIVTDARRKSRILYFQKESGKEEVVGEQG